MLNRFKFQICVFFSGVMIIASACQDPDDFPMTDPMVGIPNAPDEITALPAAVLYPDNNPHSTAKADLGRMLFWDPVLSGAKDVACATCHHPDLGYADGRDLSSGINGIGLGPNRRGGELVRRNAPTVINTAFNGMDINGRYNPENAPMFWDNRAQSLEEQALLPILSHEEMRGPAIAEADIVDSVVQRLNAIPGYRNMFASAFGDGGITETRIAQALATFQRDIVANNSPFDQYIRGDETAMSNQAIQGMNTFLRVGCAECHNGPMFSDFDLHTLSVPDHPLVDDAGANGDFDFRTPTLRNLDVTAPYMHNGVFDNLRDVLEFYNDISGGGADSQNPNVADNQIAQDARRLQLNGGDINEIISFLEALNDENFDRTIPQQVPSGLPVGGAID